MSERQLITVSLPLHDRCYRPDPFPGGKVAMQAGCTCPSLQPWPGRLIFASDCPIHELEKVTH